MAVSSAFSPLSQRAPLTSNGISLPCPIRNGHGASVKVPGTSTSRFMFTGIVEEMGEVVSCKTRDDMTLWDGSTGSGTELAVKGAIVMDGAYLG